ncbi:MAG: shikimate kinase [Treponema sp.]|jgi:shikimate kinase|nr:shikimate kinase [Treponema sp.]
MGIIILTGPKHSGKTSAGRALAALVSGVFTDLDASIQTQTGKSPRTLYREGPGVFRKAEAEALGRLLGEGAGPGPRIVAAGGGLIDNPEALALLEQAERAGAACGVYIEISAGTAWERIAAAAGTEGLPPFLNTGDPQETHQALHERRAAAYRERARFTVAGDGKSPEEIAGEIAGLAGL